MKYTANGTLTVKTITASGALPISEALVNIVGADEENAYIEHSTFTDADGLTPTYTLPTPALEYSLTPSPDEIPYSKYDIKASAEGYYPINIIGASVFANTHSLQVINMIPLTENSEINSTELLSDTDSEM